MSVRTKPSADYYRRHPFYEVPLGSPLFDSEHFELALGSDLVLSACTNRGESDVRVDLFDSDGNCMTDNYPVGRGGFARFRTVEAALAALPTIAMVARELYPNHLLMDSDAE